MKSCLKKTIALLDRARTEPRDLYDLWYLLEQNNSLSDCMDAIKAKLLHRGKELDDVYGEFHKKEARLRKTWESRLATQIAYLPKFENVYRVVETSF